MLAKSKFLTFMESLDEERGIKSFFRAESNCSYIIYGRGQFSKKDKRTVRWLSGPSFRKLCVEVTWSPVLGFGL
jgi:hypothetical protein